MRLTPLRGLILCSFLAILVFIAYVQDSDNDQHLRRSWSAPRARPGDAARRAAAQDFWIEWATVYDAARPQIPKIDLQRSASTLRALSTQTNRKRPIPIFHIEESAVESLKKSHAILDNFLEDYDSADAQFLFEGTGVVTVAGGEYFGPAIVGIHALRQSGSKLPVELFLANKAEYEPKLCERYLPKLNARCLVLTDFIDVPSKPTGANLTFDITHYQLKSLALLFSSFSNVLLLDSDSIPLIEPQVALFQSNAFIENGFIGWPDLWTGTEHPDFYTIAGYEGFPPDLPPACAEAGQLVIDKTRHLKTLILAVYYNIFGPGYYYELLSQGALGQGDKNTFESAAVVLSAPYHRVNFDADIIGRWNDGIFRGTAIVQMHPDTGKPAFIHSNTPKMNAGHLVDEGDLVDRTTGEHLRLWGERKNAVELFGSDVERSTWEIVVETGCKLAKSIEEWKDREDICKRLRAHWDQLFEGMEDLDEDLNVDDDEDD